jgi:hypothetical protein
VIVGPILAIFMGHVFGAALGTRVALGRPLTRRERAAVFVEECRFLLVAVPPLAILVVLAIFGVSYKRIIQVIVFTGVLSLGLWGGVAGRRAGLTGWRWCSRSPPAWFSGASSWCSRRCFSPVTSPSVRKRGRIWRKGAGAFRLRVDDRHAAELHADGFSAR